MTVEEWLACEDPVAVLLLLLDGNRGTNHRFLLFAVGYCRFEQPPDERSREGIEFVERFAEGRVTAEEFTRDFGRTWTTRAYEFLEELLVRRAERDAEVDERRLTALFYCVFGDPRRPPSAMSASWLAWNDGCVVKLAAAIYEERMFQNMPLLADALEDAGCTDKDILSHCREQGAKHVRGCFVLDLLLQKE